MVTIRQVFTTATLPYPRNRRSTDLGRSTALTIVPRPIDTPIVVQRPGGPVYDWADDSDVNDDLTKATGIDRETVDVAGWLRFEIG